MATNFTRGPFSSDQFLNQFQEAATDLVTHLASEPEDPFWDVFYPSIARSLGDWPAATAYTWDHKMEILQRLQYMEPLHKQGEMVKLSRWFSIWDAYDQRIQMHGPFTLMVLCYIGIFKDWLLMDENLLSYHHG